MDNIKVVDLMNFLDATESWPGFVKVMAWDVLTERGNKLTAMMADVAGKFADDFSFVRCLRGRNRNLEDLTHVFEIAKEALVYDDIPRYLDKRIYKIGIDIKN